MHHAGGGTRQLERDVDLRSHVAALEEITKIAPPDFATQGAHPHFSAQHNPSFRKICVFSPLPALDRARCFCTPDDPTKR